ncbi:MAG: L-rhamnose mutarotase [Bacillariaceae sp.]|jgi:L-rhamnose mutarotase
MTKEENPSDEKLVVAEQQKRRKSAPGNARKVFYTTCRGGMIEKYIDRHNNIPSEVCSGLRTAGITFLSINRLPKTNVLVLSMELAGCGQLDLQKATGPGSTYRKNNICCQWEIDMETQYHNGWTELEEIHSSDVEWNQSLGLPLLL